MANRLRRTSARVSFFAFQDIITTVTGVLLLVTLLLTLYLNQPVKSAVEVTRDHLRDRVAEARRQLLASTEQLRLRQAELRALTNRVFVVPETDRSGREPVLVALSATQGAWTRLGQSNVTEFSRGAADDEFRALLQTWDARRQRVIFYVRPSGIEHFNLCQELTKRRGFAYGYDTAEEAGYYLLQSP